LINYQNSGHSSSCSQLWSIRGRLTIVLFITIYIEKLFNYFMQIMEMVVKVHKITVTNMDDIEMNACAQNVEGQLKTKFI